MKKEELEKEILKSFSKKPTTNALTTEKGYFTEKEAEEMTSGTLDLVDKIKHWYESYETAPPCSSVAALVCRELKQQREEILGKINKRRWRMIDNGREVVDWDKIKKIL